MMVCLISMPAIAGKFNITEQVVNLKREQSSLFSQQTKKLSESIKQFCLKNKTAQAQLELKKNWHHAMDAWMPLQGEAKGPINELNLAWSIQFWPDKKNITGRKINKLLQSGKTSWSVEELNEQSVTVRGLGALELLIFEQKLTAENCALATATAQLLYHNSKKLSDAWLNSYGMRLLKQSKYKKQKKMIEQHLLAALSHHLSFINKKFSLPMGNTQPHPYQAESWRSESSMRQLKTSYQALQLYFNHNIAPLLLEKKKTYLATMIDQTFKDLLQSWPHQTSLKKLLSSQAGLKKLYRTKMPMDQLTYLLHEELPIALDLVIGFNATDGD